MMRSAFRVIVKLWLRRQFYSRSLFGPKKKGEVDGAIFGLLRFEERCISEKCLALEDTFEMSNFLKRSLHDVFRGSCLPECDYVELSGYGACFYKAWNVAELLNGILDWGVLYVQ